MASDSDVLIESGPRQLKAVEQLPPDMMLLKMENESIMQVARVAPREPMKIVAQLKELIEAWPAAAEEAIYSKPVGSVSGRLTPSSPLWHCKAFPVHHRPGR